VPYVFPQECGGRADVRWLYLTPQQQQQQQQQGLLIAATASTPSSDTSSSSSSSSTLQMNLSPYSWQALTAAKHQHELTPDPLGWHLRLDAAHMGVGGDDSWSPSVHDEYLLPPGRYQLGVVMRAVGGGERGAGLFAAAKQLHRSAAAPAAPASTVVS
jgi:beta-galactosidase